MKHLVKGVVVIMLMGAFVACSKKDSNGDTQVLAAVTVNDLPADTIIGVSPNGQPYGSGRFTLYSLERNQVVSNVDSNTNKWDIGFRGTTVITNSGTGGPGMGGGFVFVGTFDNLKSVPTDSTIRVDAAPSAYAITNGSNRGWYVYNPTANLVTPIPGRVLVIRTGTGKFAKVEILNYYRGGVTLPASASDDEKTRKQRFYTFRFVYQSNGSKNF